MADNDGMTSKMSMQYFSATLPIPPKLDVHGNLSVNWKRFKRVWENYEIATHLNAQPKATRVATFLTCIGADALDIYDTFVFEDDEEKDDPTVVLQKFEAHCVGATNETYERYIFNQREQEPGERIEAYVTALRRLSKTCNYGVLEDSLIRDRIVIGIQDGTVRKRLLQEANLTLKKCIDICRAAETTSHQMKTLKHEEVHAVKTTSSRSPVAKTREAQCKFCGKQHVLLKERCPAWGKRCMLCQGPNHFAVRCPDKNKKKPVHLLEHSVEPDNDTESVMVVETISVIEPAAKRLFARFIIGDTPVRFQLDCGATVNVLPQKIYERVTRDYKLKRLQATNTQLVMYNKSMMTPCGKCRLQLTNPKNQKTHMIELMVVDSNCNPILGAQAVQELDLLTVKSENIASVEEKEVSNNMTLDTILTQFPDVFQGDGSFEGKLHLEVDNTISPVKLPVRKVPLAMKAKLKAEIENLVARKIIMPVSTPTDWISSMVAVSKSNGKIRLCLDPKPLNKALKRNHYPLATIEDILPDLSRAKVFSLLDTKNGYWHVKLDESSSVLTTFGTPWGRYRWLRMPFGIAPAPEEFQRHLDENLERLEGVKAVADDILVYGIGDTKEEALMDHDRKLKELLQRCRERGIKLNKNKLRLRLPEVRYMGFLISDKGLRCDPDKVEAISNLPRPTDKQGVQRLLGMTNFLQKFAPCLSTVVAPLRELLQKDNEFVWEEQIHGKCLNTIKQILCDAPVLRFFDVRAETHLQCDASEKGLGACLMQEGQPVAYASRSLTAAESNYAQIERELLSIVFGMEKFEPYVLGRKVTVESDHKPLEAIMKKSLLSAPKRLQRMMLRLQKFDLQVVYKKGSQMFLADTLSRAYLVHSTPGEEDHSEVFTIDRSLIEEEVEGIDMTHYLAVSEETLQKIKQASGTDEDTISLKQVIEKGWPDKKEDVPYRLQPYFPFRDELSTQGSLVFKGDRLVVPRELRGNMLQRIHSSHIGIQGCLRRAREAVFWPGMCQNIEMQVSDCTVCAKFADKQQRQPMIPYDIPDRPWQTIACDLFELDGRSYIVCVDYYSNFFEVDRLQEKRSIDVIRKIKATMARYGIPETVVTDNGPPFNGQEFQQFAKNYEFLHVTSSPYYPRSNGKAENAVKTAKRLLKKAAESNSDPYLALLDWRNTPTEGLQSSPAQRLLGRRTRTLLPLSDKLLKPLSVPQVTEQLKARKRRQKKYYDRGTKELRGLNAGEPVYVLLNKEHSTWTPATIIQQVGIRSYELLTDDGKRFRRNRNHIRVRNLGKADLAEEEDASPVIAEKEIRESASATVPMPTNSKPMNKEEETSTEQHPPVSHSDRMVTVSVSAMPVPPAGCSASGRFIRKPAYLKDYET